MGDNKDTNNTDDQSYGGQQIPITPEGLPIQVNTPVESNQKIEILNEKTETEIGKTEQLYDTMDTVENPTKEHVSTLIDSNASRPENVIDKTTQKTINQELDTIDTLSKKADSEEEDFIQNVETAHEHN